MEKSEIMRCAAILAAGVMANEHQINVYNAERAVALMNQIAEIISSQESGGEITYPMV